MEQFGAQEVAVANVELPEGAGDPWERLAKGAP
jgi:hypothetical protein